MVLASTPPLLVVLLVSFFWGPYFIEEPAFSLFPQHTCFRFSHVYSCQQFFFLLVVHLFSLLTILPNEITFSSGLCLQMFDNDLSLGNIIVRFNLGKPQIDNKWYTPCLTIPRFKYVCQASCKQIKFFRLPLTLNSCIRNSLTKSFIYYIKNLCF